MSEINYPGKHEPGSAAAADWTAAKQLYENGEYEACFSSLPAGFRKDANYRPLYQLAAAAAARLDAPHAQELFMQAAENPEDAAALDELGNLFFSGNDFNTALVFLEKAVHLDPANTGCLYDLALCHTRVNQLNKAVDLLQNARSHDFWTLYLLNKLKLFKQNTQGVQEFIDSLSQLEAGEDDIKKMKGEDLQEMLQRLNMAGAVRPHIRDWHFIQYGGAVLDCNESHGGRYASVSCTNESLKALAEKLKSFLAAVSAPVKKIAALPDRDSEIIGRLLAKTLNVPFGIYDDEHPSAGTLVVAADSALFDDYYELGTITGGHMLFSASHNWRSESYVCPDIIGLMAQSCIFPWQEGTVKIIDAGNQVFEPVQPDDRNAAAIAEDIFHTPPQQDTSDLVEFYSARKDYLKGIGPLAGTSRYNFMVESPVPDPFFT